nr:hypothetical protein [Pandoravirus massiliensis]
MGHDHDIPKRGPRKRKEKTPKRGIALLGRNEIIRGTQKTTAIWRKKGHKSRAGRNVATVFFLVLLHMCVCVGPGGRLLPLCRFFSLAVGGTMHQHKEKMGQSFFRGVGSCGKGAQQWMTT